MGDSYSSGEGVTPDDSWAYYRETDHDGTDKTLRNACHRSIDAWSRLGKLSDNPGQSIGNRADTFDPSLDYPMTACQGARAHNLWRGDPGEYGEPAQLDQGYLDQYTNLVTLSIGGNDARFTDILNNCVTYIPAHVGGGSCADMSLDNDGKPVSQTIPALLTGSVVPDMEKTIGNVAAAANAAPCTVLFGGSSITWFRGIAGQLHDLQSQEVTKLRDGGLNIRFADPVPVFDGKGACGTAEAIHSTVTRFSHGDAKQAVSQQSFHPNEYGSTLYVRALAAKDLADIVADPATRSADPRQAAQRVSAYLTPPNPTETTVRDNGFEVRTHFDEPWSDQGQEHRVRLCVAYVTRHTDPVTLADRPCPPGLPGPGNGVPVDREVKLAD